MTNVSMRIEPLFNFCVIQPEAVGYHRDAAHGHGHVGAGSNGQPYICLGRRGIIDAVSISHHAGDRQRDGLFGHDSQPFISLSYDAAG